MGDFVRTQPCTNCGSRSGGAIYTDNFHCFSCGHHENYVQENAMYTEREQDKSSELIQGEFKALVSRGITEETCKHFGYKVGTYKDSTWQIAPYYAEGKQVGQKLRNKSKEFKCLGNMKDVDLFGQHLWKDGGKMVVVTEGEIDCMSVSQLQGNKWATVSLPNGVSSAKKAIQRNLEWLERFETVVLMFDMDDPGQKAVHEIAPLFSPGKCKIARLPLKDANEMLMASKGAEVVNAIWNAKTYRPDGVISGTDTWEIISKTEVIESSTYPWADVNNFLNGVRRGELVTVTAGSGIGKSLFCRELAYHLLNAGETVGYVALEESVKRTVQGFMGMHLNKPIHISQEGIEEHELREAWEATAGSGRLYMYDHWGSTDSDNLISRLRYLCRGCGCNWLVLDHISIVVSGIGEGDERRILDNTMTKLRSLVEETGVGLILVSHLKRPEGNKGHEDGLHTSLAHLRGSAAIAQLSDVVIGLERNQQSEDRNKTTVRVLKNRFTGMTGLAGGLHYNTVSGRLESASMAEPEDVPEVIF